MEKGVDGEREKLSNGFKSLSSSSDQSHRQISSLLSRADEIDRVCAGKNIYEKNHVRRKREFWVRACVRVGPDDWNSYVCAITIKRTDGLTASACIRTSTKSKTTLASPAEIACMQREEENFPAFLCIVLIFWRPI